MSYKGLARKYRPSSFSELIGHDALIRTLSNAIILNHLPHAILLTGTRGIGKTTTARIIAKSLNCLSSDQPVVQSCSQCQQCISIAQGNNQDVLEIDAASHTGVQDIRELIENVKYRPVYGRYKVYIIDEVHMLSNSAFNALLKTLEEPPAHAKFIFATTEIRKIPLTIISRCQRFTLRRMVDDELADHYNKILQKEQYTAETEAMQIIVRAADGSVRDGLSMLDQAIAMSAEGNILTTSTIRQMIGFAEDSLLRDIICRVIEGKLQEALESVRTLYADGVDVGLIIQGILEQIYHMITAKICGDTDHGQMNSRLEQGEQTASARSILKVHSSLKMPFLLRAWQTMISATDDLRSSSSELMSLEIALIKLAHLITYETPEALAQALSGNKTPDSKPPANQLRGVDSASPDISQLHNELRKMLNTAAQYGDILLYQWLSSDIGIIDLSREYRHMIVYKTQKTKSRFADLGPDSLPDDLVNKSLNEIYGGEWTIEISDQPALSLVELEKARNRRCYAG